MLAMSSQVQTNRCSRVADDRRVDLDACDPQPEMYFELTADGRLLATATGQCLTVTENYYITAEECKKPVDDKQVRYTLNAHALFGRHAPQLMWQLMIAAVH
jgi:hypothetical protein